MRYVVVTTSLNRITGANYVAVAFIRLLKELGKTVWLASLDKPNDAKLRSVYGDLYVPPDKTLYDIGMLDVLDVVLKKDLFVVNTYADLLAYPFSANYFHTVPLDPASSSLNLKNTSVIDALAEVLASHVGEVINMCNSKLTQRKLVEYGIHATVVRPPVIPVREVKHAEKKYIGYFGRIAGDKNLGLLLDVAERLRHIPFLVAGKAEPTYGRQFIAEVRRRGLDNVKVVTDLSHADKPRVLSSMRVVIHTKFGEPFGLAPLEAVYAGALPLLPCESGAYELFDGIFPCFRDAEEAVSYAEDMYRQYSEMKSIIARHQVRSEASYESFRNRVVQLFGL